MLNRNTDGTLEITGMIELDLSRSDCVLIRIVHQGIWMDYCRASATEILSRGTDHIEKDPSKIKLVWWTSGNSGTLTDADLRQIAAVEKEMRK